MAAIGIDLGTTNSLIAHYTDDGPKLIPNALGTVLTPSAVSLADDGSILTGLAARDRLLSHPDRSAAAFKRFMGTAKATTLGKKAFRPEELSSFILRSLKEDAEAALGAPVTEAVVSVPAYFNDQQRKATLDAGQLAGLTVSRIVNEPTAAALAYGLADAKEGLYLIFDLGGGTFDVSILDKYSDVFEIRATTGDTRLGGDDFTNAVENLFARKHDLNLDGMKGRDRAIVARQAEAIKTALSSGQSSEYGFDIKDEHCKGAISRQDFETECAPLIQRLRLPTERAVRDAGMSPSKFDAIVLVGGATRMPMVRSLVAKMFGRLPLVNIDPDTTVALGAAVQAGLLKRQGALKDVVMTDVCPFTLGVATVDDAESPHSRMSVSAVIERNAVVPISRSITLATVQDRQSVLAVQVYQGENLRPENNVHLGSIDVKVPRGPKGREQLDIRFTYDTNGALQVEATVLSTGKLHKQIMRNTSGMSEGDLSRRFAELDGLKMHPRELAENQALISRAERVYEECRGETRELIRTLLAQFESEIGSQQLRDPGGCRERFAEELDQIERSPFRSQ